MVDAAGVIAEWRWNPVKFVRDNFKVEPDEWQADALRLLPSNGGIARIALKACAGPGKTAALAWSGWWFMLTQAEVGEHPKGLALSITKDNLRDNLWSELSKWQQRSPLLSSAFHWGAERIVAKAYPETWFLAARSFAVGASAEAQKNSLSGHHAKRVFYLLDESGDMNVAVGQAVEQGLNNVACGLAIQAGNPTKLTGLLADSVTHGWQTVTITADPDDPKRTPRVSAEWAREQIARHGRDNPWVMALILGLFPPGGINQLMGIEDVERSFARSYLEGDIQMAAKVIGVDCARMGDDASTIYRRQGLMSWKGEELRNVEGWQLGDRVAYTANQWGGVDAIFVDTTGGHGNECCYRLKQLGFSPIRVEFAGKADDDTFANKRAEMYWKLSQWVKREGQMARDPLMLTDCIGPTYSFNPGGKMLIESKEDMKKRGLKSPDHSDGLACTFYKDVLPQRLHDALARDQQTFRKQFNPLGRVGGYGK